MYLAYWKLHRHPFDNMPDPHMYFGGHKSLGQIICDLLFTIEKTNKSLAAIVGPAGVGKTMCLRLVLNSLEKNKYRTAFVTNPELTFQHLLREILGQLEGRECIEHNQEKLLEKFRKILFETSESGRKTVIFIDEGSVIQPDNLEKLHLLTSMQDDHQHLLTIILAGQPELGRLLENPRRDNLFQRMGVYCKIEGLDSLQTMKDYIEHRLKRAGLSGRPVFDEAAYNLIWKSSCDGMPRLINKICTLSLKAGESKNLSVIGADAVSSVTGGLQHHIRPVKNNKERTESPVSSIARPRQEMKVLSIEEKEAIASTIATEQVGQLSGVLDPFEAWNQLRQKILKEMNSRVDEFPGHALA